MLSTQPDTFGRAGVADANAQSPEVAVAAQCRDDIPETVMPTVAAVVFESGLAGRDIQFVVGNQNCIGLDAVVASHGGDRSATFVHEGLGNQQPQVVPSDRAAR